MKSFVKALVLAPVMVLALTACEAKISEDEAKERANGYDLAAVSEKYASFDSKGEVKIKKRTGVFEEGGIMASVVDIMVEAIDGEHKDQEVASGFFTLADISSISGGEEGEVEITYYSYKKSGLKIVSNTKINMEEEGIAETGSTKTTSYILDDGRMEKGTGSTEMKVSGSMAGITIEGELSLTYSVSYTWNAK